MPRLLKLKNIARGKLPLQGRITLLIPKALTYLFSSNLATMRA